VKPFISGARETAIKATACAVTDMSSAMSEGCLKNRLEKKEQHRPFDFDVYYPQIQRFSFESDIVPFSRSGDCGELGEEGM